MGYSETPDHTQGGGIPEDSLEQVFQYGYTTVDDGDLLAQVPPAPLGPQRHVLCGLHCHLRLDVRLSSTRHALAAAEMYVARPACPRRAGSWWPILMDTTASIYMVCMHPVKKGGPQTLAADIWAHVYGLWLHLATCVGVRMRRAGTRVLCGRRWLSGQRPRAGPGEWAAWALGCPSRGSTPATLASFLLMLQSCCRMFECVSCCTRTQGGPRHLISPRWLEEISSLTLTLPHVLYGDALLCLRDYQCPSAQWGG